MIRRQYAEYKELPPSGVELAGAAFVLYRFSIERYKICFLYHCEAGGRENKIMCLLLLIFQLNISKTLLFLPPQARETAKRGKQYENN